MKAHRQGGGEARQATLLKRNNARRNWEKKIKEHLKASLEQYPSGHLVVGCQGPRNQRHMSS